MWLLIKNINKYIRAFASAHSIILLFFFINCAHALDPEKNLNQYIIESWQLDEGMPQNSAYTIIQTSDGYLWIGTQEGLARFDGVTFDVFNLKNRPELGSDWIRSLCEDSNGNLWIGTNGGGVTILSRGVFSSFKALDSLSSSRVLAILEDAGGNIWIGTDGSGLYKYNAGVISHFSAEEGLFDNRVRSLCLDPQNNVWAGTADGLNRIVNDKVLSGVNRDRLKNNTIMALYSRQDEIWIGTDGDGLYRLRNNKLTNFNINNNLPDPKIRSINGDAHGSIWVGTEGGGISRLDGRRFTTLNATQGLTNNSIFSLAFDDEESLWIGTHGGGLNRLKDGKFTIYTKMDGLLSNDIFAIMEDSKNRIWIGTDDGLNVFNGKEIRSFTMENGLSNNMCISLYEAGNGDIWIGTVGGGVNVWNNSSFSHYSAKEGLSNDRIYAMTGDHNGNIWVGTWNGLNRIRDKEITQYYMNDGLSHNKIRCLTEDRNGVLWIGTDGGGITLLKNGQFTTLTSENGLSSNIVSTFYEDERGIMWVGLFDGGLARISDGEIVNYTTSDGLFDNAAYRILEDDIGYFWMSSNNGIFKVHKNQLEEFANGEIRRIQSIVYGKGDGMKSRECNGGIQPAGWKTRKGDLLFPTVQGMVSIKPNRLKKNLVAPKLDIGKFLVEGNEVKKALEPNRSGFIIGPDEKNFEIHYTALSFMNQKKVSFKYRLKGYSDDWLDVGNRRIAYYTNLGPGDYEFQVIASNNDGIWNYEGASLLFTIRPLLYRTGWFILLVNVILLLLIYGIYKLRIRQLERRKKKLELLVSERTALLGEAITELERLSNQDEMTGIANHRRFREFLTTEWRRAYRNKSYITVILIDLDNFKDINDEYGHLAGDQCLAAMAKRLSRIFQRPGDLIARYGGDEFVAVLPETDLKGARFIAEELQTLSSMDPILIQEESLRISMTTSVGYASTIPQSGEMPDKLIKEADEALYKSKKTGKNKISEVGY